MSWEFPRNATLSIWFNYYFRFKLTTNAEDFSVPGTIGTEIEIEVPLKVEVPHFTGRPKRVAVKNT